MVLLLRCKGWKEKEGMHFVVGLILDYMGIYGNRRVYRGLASKSSNFPSNLCGSTPSVTRNRKIVSRDTPLKITKYNTSVNKTDDESNLFKLLCFLVGVNSK